MCKKFKSTPPRTRLTGQQSKGKKEKSYKLNDNRFIQLEPPSSKVSIYIKNLLVQLGVRGIIPRRVCTLLINLLGLRGA